MSVKLTPETLEALIYEIPIEFTTELYCKGVWIPGGTEEDDKIMVNPDNCFSRDDLYVTILHEYTHHLDPLLTEKQVERYANYLFENKPDVIRVLDDYYGDKIK